MTTAEMGKERAASASSLRSLQRRPSCGPGVAVPKLDAFPQMAFDMSALSSADNRNHPYITFAEV